MHSRFLIPLLLFGSLAGCGSRELKKGVSADAAFPARFSTVRDRILMPRCGGCHGIVASHSQLLKNLVVPFKPSESELFEEIEGGEMPPYGTKLMDEEITSLRKWIENGALND